MDVAMIGVATMLLGIVVLRIISNNSKLQRQIDDLKRELEEMKNVKNT